MNKISIYELRTTLLHKNEEGVINGIKTSANRNYNSFSSVLWRLRVHSFHTQMIQVLPLLPQKKQLLSILHQKVIHPTITLLYNKKAKVILVGSHKILNSQDSLLRLPLKP